MPRTIEFTDSYRYAARTGANAVRRPIIPVRIFNVRDRHRSLDLSMLLDSGADTSCLPAEMAYRLGIDLSALTIISTSGVGGAAATYRHDGLLLALANTVVRCPVLFMPGLSVFLLGREGVFDSFVIGFEQRTETVHMGRSIPLV